MGERSAGKRKKKKYISASSKIPQERRKVDHKLLKRNERNSSRIMKERRKVNHKLL